MGAAGLPALVRGWGQDWGTSFICPAPSMCTAPSVHIVPVAPRCPDFSLVSRLQAPTSVTCQEKDREAQAGTYGPGRSRPDRTSSGAGRWVRAEDQPRFFLLPRS